MTITQLPTVFSYICCNPIASIKIENNSIIKTFPDGISEEIIISTVTNIPTILQNFASQFKPEKNNFKFINNGLFGYMSYDAVQYFEKITIAKKENDLAIPELYYAVYQNIIAINHFKNEAYIFCHSIDNTNNIKEIEQLLQTKTFASFSFTKEGTAVSNLTNDEFKNNVTLAKNIVIVVMFFNSFYLEDFHKPLKAMNSMFIVL